MKFVYPLKITFQLIALAPRIKVSDANNQEILYIEQKVFALKEAVKVFNNSTDKQLLYTMKANQILDFGARYFIKTADEKVLGSVQQEALKSLFRGSYAVSDEHEQPRFTVVQSNPWASLLDSLINIIPFAELVTAFILNPTYKITRVNENQPILMMKKKPSLFEAQFMISDPLGDLTPEQETLLLLALLMIVQLERNRG